MSHFGDFMDGVPVKISEKYKRPPRIELPYGVAEIPLRAQNVVDIAKYCSTFENNVLSKLKELRSAKETKKNERKHRLQLLEEAKQKKLDALAVAEEEERLKQLSVSEVSYPSTDEISALSPDDKTDKNCDIATNTDNTAEIITADPIYPSCSNPTDSQMNILQPIQVKSNYPETSLLDDPISDPLQNLKLNSKMTKVSYSHNVETLTFKDFEHDTSSPFDNVELKTINDMELLAQVLQSQRNSSTSCDPQQTYIPDQSYAPSNCGIQAQLEGVTYLPNQYMEHPMQAPGMVYSTPQHYPSNGYYNSADIENMYMPNYQYYAPNNLYPNVDYYNNQLTNTSGEVQMHNDATYIPQPYYYEYQQIPIQYQQPYNLPVETRSNNAATLQSTAGTQENNIATIQSTVVKSRSRSVPDIVNELNEEIASAKQRANERSYNPSPTPKTVPQPSSSSGRKVERKHRRKLEQLPNPYDKLSPMLQNMCQKIHGMGFPLDRVARICTLVGDNDKKVIEGLLILGELMDLGFSEGRVSAALAKHEFNRDKALDELVS